MDKIIFLDPSSNKLHYNSRKAPLSIPLENVLFFKGDGSYVEIYFEGKTNAVSVPCLLSCIEELLEGNGFIRCHNSWLVNVNKVEVFCIKEKVIKVSEYWVPISRKRWNEVKWVLADKNVELIKENNPEFGPKRVSITK